MNILQIEFLNLSSGGYVVVQQALATASFSICLLKPLWNNWQFIKYLLKIGMRHGKPAFKRTRNYPMLLKRKTFKSYFQVIDILFINRTWHIYYLYFVITLFLQIELYAFQPQCLQYLKGSSLTIKISVLRSVCDISCLTLLSFGKCT